MSDEPSSPLLGAIEVDETYVGGKPRKHGKYQKDKAAAEGRELPKNKRGAGTRKIPVVALVERGGRVVSRGLSRADGDGRHLEGCDPLLRASALAHPYG